MINSENVIGSICIKFILPTGNEDGLARAMGLNLRTYRETTGCGYTGAGKRFPFRAKGKVYIAFFNSKN